MSLEERVEGLESKLKEAAHLTEEATRKREEAAFKMERVRAQLDKANHRAKEAEKQVIICISIFGDLPSSLRVISKCNRYHIWSPSCSRLAIA